MDVGDSPTQPTADAGLSFFRLLLWKPQEEAGCCCSCPYLAFLLTSTPTADVHSLSLFGFTCLVRNRTPEGVLCPVCLYFIRFRMHMIAFQLPVVAPEESRATAKEQIREEEKSVSISFQFAPRADSSCSIYEYCMCKRQPAGPFE